MSPLLLTLLACADGKLFNAEPTCVAITWCCDDRCMTEEDAVALGPDPCDCTSDTSTPDTDGGPGTCTLTEEGCRFVD